jgi:hypothetical protein
MTLWGGQKIVFKKVKAAPIINIPNKTLVHRGEGREWGEEEVIEQWATATAGA